MSDDIHRPLADNSSMSRCHQSLRVDASRLGYRLRVLVMSSGMALSAGAALAENTRAMLIERLAADEAPSAAFKQHITQDIAFRQRAYELLRRAMLLCRSPLVRGTRPAFLDPAVASATKQMVPEVTRSMMSPNGASQASIRLARELTLVDYPDNELAELTELDRYFRSSDGKRASQLMEVARAIEILDEAIVDVNSGLRWQWPIAHVLAYMQAVGLQAEFLAAVERARPGASRLLPKLTGEMDQLLTPEELKLLDEISWDSVKSEWLGSLTSEDVRRVSSPSLSRYLHRRSAAYSAIPAALLEAVRPVSAKGPSPIKGPDQIAGDMCFRATGKTCPADTVARIQTLWSASFDAQEADELAEFRKKAQTFPDTHCVAPRPSVSPSK